MVKILQKLYSKWISSKFMEYIIRRTKLYFLPIIIPFKLTNPYKEDMYFLMDKNHHYGFIIETLVLKLKLMKDQWPEYKFNDKKIETLDILITKGSELLDILELADAENHLRSGMYLTKQKQFFDLLNV